MVGVETSLSRGCGFDSSRHLFFFLTNLPWMTSMHSHREKLALADLSHLKLILNSVGDGYTSRTNWSCSNKMLKALEGSNFSSNALSSAFKHSVDTTELGVFSWDGEAIRLTCLIAKSNNTLVTAARDDGLLRLHVGHGLLPLDQPLLQDGLHVLKMEPLFKSFNCRLNLPRYTKRQKVKDKITWVRIPDLCYSTALIEVMQPIWPAICFQAEKCCSSSN